MPEIARKVKPTAQWALWYASQSWSVIPVSAGAKVPAISWTLYQHERVSNELVIDWFEDIFPDAGVGIVTGAISGLFVVDVDEGSGKPGGDTLQELQIANDDLPETLTVRTGGGGRHFYFRMPEGIHIKSGRDILGPGIDVRGDGGFIVAPPSIHPNGNPYKWDERLKPGEIEIADAPDWLIALVRGDGSGVPVAAGSEAQINAFGKRVDGREEYMRDLVWARMIEERRSCLIKPGGPGVAAIVDELWSIYENNCKARGLSLEADGRGQKLLEGKILHALKQWDGKLRDAAERPPDTRNSSRDGTGDEPARETINRLAQLSKFNYERRRNKEAKRLGMRASVLDEEVAAARATTEDDDTNELGLFEPAPCEQEVDGADLLDGLVCDIQRYVVMSHTAAEVVALWAVHTHSFESWRHTPRLHVTAPEKGCGKSTLLDVLNCLVPRGLKTEHLSTAVLFRIVDKAKPTLLIDEVDTFIKHNEELRGCLDAGHAQGGRHLRCDGDNNDVRAFKTYAPAALAGIGNLPATIADRSIAIILQRRRPDQAVEDFRDDRAEHLRQRASQIARWVKDNSITLGAAEPAMPDGIHNRLADNWRPLLAIADVAGGEWPERARTAAIDLSGSATDDAETTKVQLLSDIRDVYRSLGKDKLSSEQIVNRLHEMEDRPWPEYGRTGKPITKNQMARLLKPFSISPGTIREGDTTIKGYRLSAFKEAFAAYLPPTTVTPSQTAENLEFTQIQTVTSPENVTVEKAQNPKETAVCDGVTVEKGGAPSEPSPQEDINARTATQSGGWIVRI